MLSWLVGLACLAVILHHLDTLLAALGILISLTVMLALAGFLVYLCWQVWAQVN